MVMRTCKSAGQAQRVRYARIIGMVESAAMTIEVALEDCPENDLLELEFISVANALADLQERIERAAGGRIDTEAGGEVA